MIIKNTKLQIAMIILILAVSLAGIILFQMNMISSVNHESERTVIKLLSENANQVKYVLDNQINNTRERLGMVNTSFRNTERMTLREAKEYLSDTLPRAYKGEVATAEGEYLDQFGNKGFIAPDEDMFRLFLDNEQICLLRQEGTEDTLMFGIPTNPVTVEGKRYSYLLAYYTLDSLMEILSVESFSGEGKIRVLGEDGLVIMSTENIETEQSSYHFFKLYENAEFFDNNVYSDYKGFHESVMRGDNFAVHVKKTGEEDKVISYAKSENFNWYVIIEVDFADVLGGLENNIQNIGFISIAFIVGIVAVALILILIITRSVNKVSREKQQLQELNASLENARHVAEEALTIAENANKSKSFFLSNMSHDIRTPMNAIVGFTNLLSKNAGNPDKVIEYTGKISASSQHLLGLINDVLDMSKIESGKTTLTLSEETIGDIVAGVNEIIQPQMRAKNHEFKIRVRDVVHERIICDRTRLNQIIINLLSNAVKYTPNGGNIELSITELKSFRNTASYEFSVSDNGYGMSPEFVSTIFDSFTREEDSRTSRIQGTGLGMAITKQLVDLMGGTVSVDSVKGVGSNFTVVLQFQLAAEENPLYWQESGITSCLVADDEEVICQSIAASMENTGVEIDCCLSGREAIEKAREKNYRLILLDYKMPGLNGIETAEKLREFIPADTLVLLLTSYEFSDEQWQKIGSVADGVLPKPFFVNTLKKKLTDVKEHRKAQQKQNLPESRSVFSGRKIMIVEDNELNSEILSEILTECGAECTICENGAVAVDTFEKSQPNEYDIIFMDVQMPVMNGYEATRMIRIAYRPDGRTVPIIAMTANAFREDVQEALDSGMDAHVAKPINIQLLEATVRKVLKSKSMSE